MTPFRLTRRFVLAAVVAATALAGAVPGRAAAATAVEPWIRLELDTIASHRVNPPRAARALALVSRAMYDVAQASPSDAAVDGAAATVLSYLFPDEAARIDALARPAAGSADFALGRRFGDVMVARAESDGSSASWSGTVPTGAGLWVATPPALVYPPLEPLAGTWRAWNLSSPGQYRPEPPPTFASPAFAEEAREVYTVWRALTAEQKRIADYWADGTGTFTPPGHWNAIALDLVRDGGWDTTRTARLFAALNTAQADAFIACWDTKYTYWSVRPVTVLRAQLEPSWLPYIATPPFPSYPSGHSTTSGAASTVLTAFFPARANELDAMAEEAAVSRLYGGIHFRSDNEAGLVLGRRVGGAAVRAYGLDGARRRARE